MTVSKTPTSLLTLSEEIRAQEMTLREGGSESGRKRQQALGRLTARQRIASLLDDADAFLELNLWAAYKMYEEDVGPVPAAGVVTGIGQVHGRPCMLVVNDATVKAGAFFPQTCKKVLRAQRVAFECGLPILYLVDSSGVYLPLQDEIFPDEDDFGRIFRNNSVLSAAGLPQYAAIMGNCIAGGAYLPVLSDTILMTQGSGLYLAGPALVKAAIGQVADVQELGGAAMHAEISGTADFIEPDDPSCLDHLRRLVQLLPIKKYGSVESAGPAPTQAGETLYDIVSLDGRKEYDMRDMLARIVDKDSFDEYKQDYGKTLVTGFARVGGHAVGIVANQRKACESKQKGIQVGGVIYPDSADKGARFIMDCNQTEVPILFFQDVMGFMVGRDAEQAGIIRSGAKLVNAVSNSIVPKITVIVGGSYGAGNYGLCGKAYDPRFIFAWPSARYAVMGAEQASGVLFDIQKKAAERTGQTFDHEELDQLRERIRTDYLEKTDIRYGAARGWVDAIIAPHETRDTLITTLGLVGRETPISKFKTGVIQT